MCMKARNLSTQTVLGITTLTHYKHFPKRKCFPMHVAASVLTAILVAFLCSGSMQYGAVHGVLHTVTPVTKPQGAQPHAETPIPVDSSTLELKAFQEGMVSIKTNGPRGTGQACFNEVQFKGLRG